MKRTAEELVALRAKRERDDGEKDREERRRQRGRLKRRKMNGGALIDELGLTTEELQGLVLDAGRPGTRMRWVELARGTHKARALADESPPLADAAE